MMNCNTVMTWLLIWNSKRRPWQLAAQLPALMNHVCFRKTRGMSQQTSANVYSPIVRTDTRCGEKPIIVYKSLAARQPVMIHPLACTINLETWVVVAFKIHV